MDKEIEKQSDVYKELIKFLNVSLRPSIKDRADFNRSTAMYNDNNDWKSKYEKRYSHLTNSYCFSALASAFFSLATSSEELLYLTLYMAPFPLVMHLITKHLEKSQIKEHRRYAKLLQELAECQNGYKFPFDVDNKKDFNQVANYVEEFTNMDYDSYIALLRHIRGEEERSK